jgi:hypothetical protein
VEDGLMWLKAHSVFRQRIFQVIVFSGKRVLTVKFMNDAIGWNQGLEKNRKANVEAI